MNVMDNTTLIDTAATMVCAGKGILAADESTSTIGKRFDGLEASFKTMQVQIASLGNGKVRLSGEAGHRAGVVIGSVLRAPFSPPTACRMAGSALDNLWTAFKEGWNEAGKNYVQVKQHHEHQQERMAAMQREKDAAFDDAERRAKKTLDDDDLAGAFTT